MEGSMSGKNVLLVGTGGMGLEYHKALAHLGIKPVVVGNTRERAEKFAEKTGAKPLLGGVAANLDAFKKTPFDLCFIAVTESAIEGCLKAVSTLTVPKIIVEKPGASSPENLLRIHETITKRQPGRFFIAYNRRFYRSVDLIRKFSQEDGGIRSVFFDFTEVSDRVLSFKFPEERLKNWFFLNSTHIVDLAFDLIGWPKTLQAANLGAKSWHGSGDVFSGFGTSEKGIPFSYHSDWNSPGRWAVEVMTEKRRFILKPLEELQVQMRNQFKYEKVEFEKPAGFKDGILEIVEAAIKSDFSRFTGFEDQVKHLKVYETIRNGGTLV